MIVVDQCRYRRLLGGRRRVSLAFSEDCKCEWEKGGRRTMAEEIAHDDAWGLRADWVTELDRHDALRFLLQKRTNKWSDEQPTRVV